MSKPIEVPIKDLFKVSKQPYANHPNQDHLDESDSSDDDAHQEEATAKSPASSENGSISPVPSEEIVEEEDNSEGNVTEQQYTSSGRPKRNCGPPKRLIDEWSENR